MTELSERLSKTAIGLNNDGCFELRNLLREARDTIEHLTEELATETHQGISERKLWSERYASLKAAYDNEFTNTEALLAELRAVGEICRRKNFGGFGPHLPQPGDMR